MFLANYAVQQLASVDVTMYLDAGHAGWLGWPANLSPAAQLFSQVYTTAGKPAQLRGLATSKSIPLSYFKAQFAVGLVNDNIEPSFKRRGELQCFECRIARSYHPRQPELR